MRPFDLIYLLGQLRFWWAGFRASTYALGDKNVVYWEGGKGEPVLLIHGLGGSTLQDFRRIATGLLQTHRVITLDLPGFGLSHKAKLPQGIARQAEFIRGFLDFLQLDKVHVVGNSMGGWIALKLAYLYPKRIRKLVLIASAGILFDPPPLEIFTPKNEEGMRRLVEYLFYKAPPLPKWFLRDWLRISMQRRQAVIDMLDSMTTREDLLDKCAHEIQTPTLILWGECDRLIPPETGKRLVSILPNAHLEIIKNCGHVVIHENLPIVMHYLKKWLLE